MSALPDSRKHRRPKPVNFGTRRALRLGPAEEAAVASMRSSLAKTRGVDADDVKFSDALRLLLVGNEKAARVLAGQPETWTSSRTVELPLELWDGLSECRNRLSHSQGSLYNMSRKLNFDQGVSPAELRDAFLAVQESKDAIARMEAALVEFASADPAAADAEASDGRS